MDKTNAAFLFVKIKFMLLGLSHAKAFLTLG